MEEIYVIKAYNKNTKETYLVAEAFTSKEKAILKVNSLLTEEEKRFNKNAKERGTLWWGEFVGTREHIYTINTLTLK